jgi:hypothetical protein
VVTAPPIAVPLLTVVAPPVVVTLVSRSVEPPVDDELLDELSAELPPTPETEPPVAAKPPIAEPPPREVAPPEPGDPSSEPEHANELAATATHHVEKPNLERIKTPIAPDRIRL